MIKQLLGLIILLPMTVFAQDLKVLSWNTFLLPPLKLPLVGSVMNNTQQEDRAQQMGKQLTEQDHDILFFQETFHKKSRNILEEELKSKFPHHAYPEKKKFGTLTGSGLAIYSRHPMQMLEEIVFEHTKGTDKLARKGAMLVEITLPSGKKVQFVNTHLQAWNNPGAVKVRQQQLQEIKDLMARHKKDGVAQFLVGDLNVNGNLPTEFNEAIRILSMEPAKLQGELQITNGFDTVCYKNPGGEPEGEWLDHLFSERDGASVKSQVKIYNGTLKYKDPETKKKSLCESCPLSDHYAVEHAISLK